MKILIDTKWVECLADFGPDTKLILYEAIFDYMSDKEVRLPNDTWPMFTILRSMLDEEKNKRLRLAERSRENGKKGGRKAENKNPKEHKKPTRLSRLYEDESRSETLRKFDGWIKANAPYVYENLDPLTDKEFESIREKYTSKQMADTIEQIENRKDLRKRYKNLYRTLLNWLKVNYGES